MKKDLSLKRVKILLILMYTANNHSRSTKVLKIKQKDHNDSCAQIEKQNWLKICLQTITKEDGKRTLLHWISQSMVVIKANIKTLIELLNIQNSPKVLEAYQT